GSVDTARTRTLRGRPRRRELAPATGQRARGTGQRIGLAAGSVECCRKRGKRCLRGGRKKGGGRSFGRNPLRLARLGCQVSGSRKTCQAVVWFLLRPDTLELNPLVCRRKQISPLQIAARFPEIVGLRCFQSK